jgi:hypothetical protein
MAEVLECCARAREISDGWFDPWAMPGGIDPTGYVKGWAAQCALSALVSSGIRGAMVNAVGGGPRVDLRGERVLYVRDELVHSDFGEVFVHGYRHQVELMGSGPKHAMEKRFQLEWGAGTPQGNATEPKLLQRECSVLTAGLGQFELAFGNLQHLGGHFLAVSSVARDRHIIESLTAEGVGNATRGLSATGGFPGTPVIPSKWEFQQSRALVAATVAGVDADPDHEARRQGSRHPSEAGVESSEDGASCLFRTSEIEEQCRFCKTVYNKSAAQATFVRYVLLPPSPSHG